MRMIGLLNSIHGAMVAVALTAVVVAATRMEAQSAPKSPNGMPDIVGLYPGMPVGDAYNLLKAYYPTRGGRVDVHQDAIQGLNGDQPLATQLHIPPSDQQGIHDDLVDVFITLPPNKQTVWAVTRSIDFEEGKSPSAEALEAGLRQKYGPEMPDAHPSASGITMRWIFDRQGKRVADSFVRCGQISNGGPDSIPRGLVSNPAQIQFANLTQTPVGVPGGESCKTFVYLQAYIGIEPTNSHIQLMMYDLGAAVNAGLRTQAVIRGLANAEEKQAAQQQKKVDKTTVPSF